jgi:transcriptional antiterminator RfaH
MTQSLVQLSKVDTPLWFCVKAQPKREHLAASSLQKLANITAYAPRIRFRKLTKRGLVWFVEPLFPGYFFAEFVFTQQRRLVEHSTGVHYIVAFGEQVPTLDPASIALLQQSAGDGEIVTIDPEIKVGQDVEIAEGPFQGLRALVTRVIPAKQRVQVLLEFLGRSLETELPTPRVLPVEGARQSFRFS